MVDSIYGKNISIIAFIVLEKIKIYEKKFKYRWVDVLRRLYLHSDLSISAEIFSFFLTLLDLPTVKISTKPVRLTENILLKLILVYVKYLLNGSRGEKRIPKIPNPKKSHGDPRDPIKIPGIPRGSENPMGIPGIRSKSQKSTGDPKIIQLFRKCVMWFYGAQRNYESFSCINNVI